MKDRCICACIAMLAGIAMMAPAISKAESSWLNFQLNGVGVFQGGGVGGNTFTGQVGWSPRLSLTDSFGVRGIVAGSLFKGTLSNFFVGEGQAMLSYAGLSSFLFEAGGGVQMWFGQSVTSPMVSGVVAWRPAKPLLGLMDRSFVGYSRVLASSAQSNEVKLGIGIDL